MGTPSDAEDAGKRFPLDARPDGRIASSWVAGGGNRMTYMQAWDHVESAESGNPVWTASILRQRQSWKRSLPDNVSAEFSDFLAEHPNCVENIEDTAFVLKEMPEMSRFGGSLRESLLFGDGVAWVKGLDSTAFSIAEKRLFFASLGMSMGRVMREYGCLYSVRDRGVDYTLESVPVSMTRDETGMHTDSSALNSVPDFVGLLCEVPSKNGGDSLITNALNIYWRLRVHAPRVLEILEGNFIRDIVTPGAERNDQNLLENSFPIFSSDLKGKSRTFRYMRYWIEKGQDSAGRPLTLCQLAALNQLDQALGSEENLVRLHMDGGDMLWINNRTVAHGRRRYFDTPGNQRQFQRMWIEVP